MLELVYKVKNLLMLDNEKLSHMMKLKHREALNLSEKAWHIRQSSITYIDFVISKHYSMYM